MRIGIFDPYLDDLGGGEKYMMTIAELLSQKNDLTVFWDYPLDLEKISQRFDLDLSQVKISRNIFSPRVKLWERLLVSKKFDLLIILSDGSIPLVFSRKTFLHIQQPLKAINKKSWKSYLKYVSLDRIMYNSEFTKKFNKRHFGKIKDCVIYPPVDDNFKNVKKENIIIHVGRFRVVNVKNEDYKKQQVMVNVFKKMVDEGLSNWKFIVATSIKNANDLKFVEMQKSAEGYPIEFLINKSNKELWDSYNKAKIYWHASGFGEDLESYPEYAEHFGITTVEAMNAGVVPIVINAGGQKEIIENGLSGFLWDNLNELVSKTMLLITDEARLKKMSVNSKIRAKIFSKHNFNRRIGELIK